MSRVLDSSRLFFPLGWDIANLVALDLGEIVLVLIFLVPLADVNVTPLRKMIMVRSLSLAWQFNCQVLNPTDS